MAFNLMYSTISLIVSSFLWPLTWALILLAVALFSKRPKHKKRALIWAIVILLLFSNKFLLGIFARAWDVDPGELKQGKVYSAAIVLGGFTNEDFSRHGFFMDHSDRLIEGMYLKSSGRVSHIFISGGNADPGNDGFTEAAWIRKTLLDMRYPDTAILIDPKSQNTNENATFTRRLLDSAHLKPPYLLVTSAFHMRRARYDFKKRGVDVIPYPCDYLAGNAQIGFLDYITPNANVMSAWDYYLREVVGLWVEHLKS